MSAVFPQHRAELPDPWVESVLAGLDALRAPVAPAYVPVSRLASMPRELEARMLGLVGFGELLAKDASVTAPQVLLPMTQFGGEPMAECWFSPEPVRQMRQGSLQYAWNEQVLFGSVRQPACPGEGLEQQTRLAYLTMLDLLGDQGFPHLLRIWNHFPGINVFEEGMERYRRFCIGRHEALLAREYLQANEMPAASAVGSASGELWLYFLAARRAARHVENPRQVSAYRYPPQYGRRSPSFARATVMDWDGEWQLYISGTASIVGHETLWLGDVIGQLDETLGNMQAVLDQSGASALGCKLRELSVLKVYVRDPAHLEVLRAALRDRIGQTLPILFLQGDICRQDLLLEIEGVLRVPGGSR